MASSRRNNNSSVLKVTCIGRDAAYSNSNRESPQKKQGYSAEYCSYCQKEVGHRYPYCDNPNVQCKICGEKGHNYGICPKKPKMEQQDEEKKEYCSYCQKEVGHKYPYCDNPNVQCKICGEKGHNYGNCPKGKKQEKKQKKIEPILSIRASRASHEAPKENLMRESRDKEQYTEIIKVVTYLKRVNGELVVIRTETENVLSEKDGEKIGKVVADTLEENFPPLPSGKKEEVKMEGEKKDNCWNTRKIVEEKKQEKQEKQEKEKKVRFEEIIEDEDVWDSAGEDRSDFH